MELKSAKVVFPFAAGLAEHIAPALVPAGKLHTAEQAMFLKDGSVQQRPGTVTLGTATVTGGTLTAARHVFPDKRETVMTTPTRVLTYCEDDASWRDIDDAYEYQVSRTIHGERNGVALAGSTYCDIVYSNGVVVYAWEGSGRTSAEIRVRFVDYNTGAHMHYAVIDSVTASSPIRLVVMTTYVYVVWVEDTTFNLKATRYDLTDVSAAPTTYTVGANVSQTSTTPEFDACSYSNIFYAAYHYDDGAGTDVTRVVRSPDGLATTSAADVAFGAGGTEVPGMCYGIAANASYVYVAYDVDPLVAAKVVGFVRTASAALAAVAALFTLRTGTGALAITPVRRIGLCADPALATRAWVAWEQRGLGPPKLRSLNGLWMTTAGTVTEGHKTYHVGLLSRPWIYDTKIYCLGHFSESLTSQYGDDALAPAVTVGQSNAYVLEMRCGTLDLPVPPAEDPPVYLADAKARVCSRVATHTMSDASYFHFMALNISNTVNYSGHRMLSLILMLSESAIVMGGNSAEGFDVVEVEYNHNEIHSPITLQESPALSGGVPAVFSGEHMSELGFHYYPWVSSATPSNSTGQLTSEGLYHYCVVYEWRDPRGKWHRSTPGPIKQVDLSADASYDTIVLVIPTLQLTEHEDAAQPNWPVYIVVYRTKASGSVFYRLPVAITVNDLLNPWITTFTDGWADTAIETQEILYTDGGVAPNFQPPAVRHMVQHDRHIWAISAEDPTLLWVSKEIYAGCEMPGFPLQFVMRHDVGGPHTALATIGQQLVAFKEEGIYVYSGSPPNDLVQGGTLAGPVLVAAHTGCVNPKSLVNVPEGVAFQSRDSFWLINRGLQVTRIGGPVEDQVALYPVCTSAVLDQAREIVLFTMTNDFRTTAAPPSSGVTLVWHYLINEWSVWKMTNSASDGNEKDLTAPVVSAAMCWRSGTGLEKYEYHQVLLDGDVVYLKNYVDHTGLYPRLSVSTPWLQFSGLAGFQRVKRVHLRGTYVAGHTVLIKTLYDFEPEPFGTELSWDMDGIDDYVNLGGAADMNYERNQPLTLSVWFKYTGVALTSALIGKCEGAPSYQGWVLRIEATGTIGFLLANDVLAGNMLRVYSTRLVNDGLWHHVMVRYDGTSTAAGVTIWVDGAADTVVVNTDALSATIQGGGLPRLGSSAGGWFFHGKMCDVAVWESALGGAGLLTVWNDGRPGDLDSLAPVFWWRVVDHTYYPDLSDYGPASSDGTFTNMDINGIRMDCPSGPDWECFSNTDVQAVVKGFVAGTEEHFGVHPCRQKCKAVRVVVKTDSIAGTANGGQARWETIGFEVAGKKGLFKLPDAARS